MTRRRKIILILSIILMIGLGGHVWIQRYYFRFFPIPINFIDIIDEGSSILPSAQPAIPMGKINFPTANLTTEDGLRKTLDSIQRLSPFSSANGLPTYANLTFEKWFKQVQEKPIYCTDGSQLFILAAWDQGLMAREWHLLPPGWPPGQGHSVTEFFNPIKDKWQLVDAQHAGIVRDNNGRILSMSEVLIKNSRGKKQEITIDYGSYRKKMLEGARGPATEQYFFDLGLLNTPVLQLRQSTWFAKIPKTWGLRGHFFIGYPIITAGSKHDKRVFYTKLSFIGFFVLGFVVVLSLIEVIRGRYETKVN